MSEKATWVNIVFGKVTVVIATMVLTIPSLIGGEAWLVALMIGVAGFIILHAIVNESREGSIVKRLGRNYDQVQRRAVEVIADLGLLSGDQFGLWMVDLYLVQGTWSFMLRYPFIKRHKNLERRLTVSLLDARPQPPTIEIDDRPHGKIDDRPHRKCFVEAQPLLWSNHIDGGTQADSAWSTVDTELSDELRTKYGVLVVSPVVDNSGEECLGVLAIHVGPDRNETFKALSALTSQEGQQRVRRACVDLHGSLKK